MRTTEWVGDSDSTATWLLTRPFYKQLSVAKPAIAASLRIREWVYILCALSIGECPLSPKAAVQMAKIANA